MSSISRLLNSCRAPKMEELECIPWLKKLKPKEQQIATQALIVGEALAGDYVCLEGKPVRYWLGVVDGLLKMSKDQINGQTITYMGVPAGSWFGEGTVLKRENYRYNIQALRRSTVAALPMETFHVLLDSSIEFNRIIMYQLNERVAQFITGRETDRLTNPDIRVARTLVALFNPILAPGVGDVLRITQQELAYLVGLSRQRVNEALVRLVEQDLVETVYGGLRVTDMAGLRNF